MMTDAMADSRAAAVMLPTGPTAIQVKERASAAGTEGPPAKAPTRADSLDPTRFGAKDQSGTTGAEIARSVVESQMGLLPETEASARPAEQSDQIDAADAEQQQTELAKAAFDEMQKITRQVEDQRAASMRIAM